MTTARKNQVCLDQTQLYHCTSKCVRQSYLCGTDDRTGRCYEHRRQWIEDLLLLLTKAFCIDVAGYSIMSNHYHVVIRVNPDLVQSLSDEEVVKRWNMIYSPGEIAMQFLEGKMLSMEDQSVLSIKIEKWRQTLADMSRFMGYINEKIAIRANKEDGCKGRFWEGRFKSQAILDDSGLLQTLCYVDLNPVRAGMNAKPEESAHTSLKRRLTVKKNGLLPFKEEYVPENSQSSRAIPINFSDYLELVDWTGRLVRPDKRGSIPLSAPPILTRIGKTKSNWIEAMRPNLKWTQKAIGSAEHIKEYCHAVGQQWIWQHAH